jgi:hypothetical protein
MIVYVGDTRSRKLLAALRAEGIGQVAVRGRLSGRRLDPWFYDNGAFEDYRAGVPFDEAAFRADLAVLDAQSEPPAFAVLPDVVMGGAESLKLSMRWFEDVPRRDWYLAVQNGVEVDDVPWRSGIAGVFVGGDLGWKRATGARWVEAAHARGLRCHVGRVGTVPRIAWARDAGADSIDSSLPLWSNKNMRRFMQALRQSHLWAPDYRRPEEATTEKTEKTEKAKANR